MAARLIRRILPVLFWLAWLSPGWAKGPAAPVNATLRILTYNDRTAHADPEDAPSGNDWAQRRPLALRLLKELDPDVVGVQEATDGQIQELSPGFAALRKEELALLYRADRLRALEGGAIRLGVFGHPDPWGERWALWQRFQKRTGGPAFTVFVTHLSTAQDQLPQARQVLDAARTKGPRVLVLGDFNFDAGGLLPEFGFQDVVLDHGGTFHAFKGGRAGDRLDFIGARGLKPVLAGVHTGSERIDEHTVYPSDHFPVWAAFEWPR